MTSPPRRTIPDLDEFEAMAARAFARLPDYVREACGNVVFRVADAPSREVLDDMGMASELDLLGLFVGVGMAQSGLVHTGEMPNEIWLYRRPILAYRLATGETLERIVTHVLVHEIGHQLGFSDDDLYAIDDADD